MQGLEFSHISEMNFTFTASKDFMTYKNYLEQPKPMVERITNRKLYKKTSL